MLAKKKRRGRPKKVIDAPKRPRGRPRKVAGAQVVEKKRRGRPPKPKGPLDLRTPTGQKPQRGTSNSPEARAENQAKLLDTYSKCGNLWMACKFALVDRQSHYNWMAKYPEYAERFKEAKQIANERHEAEIIKRGYLGDDVPIVHRGQIVKDEKGNVVSVKKKSDILALAVLNANWKEKYGRQQHEHTGADGAPISFTLTLDNPRQSQTQNVQQSGPPQLTAGSSEENCE
jgi:hypothetical protein